MASPTSTKPHAVLVPFPAQGHINPMLDVAKLLHCHGFHITFVNTEYNHRRLVRSRGLTAVEGLEDFRFETIPDGLPDSELDGTQDIQSLCESTSSKCLVPFRELLKMLNDRQPLSSSPAAVPPVSCVVADGVMSFTVDAARELGIPTVLFWTMSACGFMSYLQFQRLVDTGLVPLKDTADLTNGYLDTSVEWIPGAKNTRLKDLPSFIRTTDPADPMLHFMIREAQRASMASAIILNTFHELELPILNAIASLLPLPIYTIGPLCLHTRLTIPPESQLNSITLSLWKEDTCCLDWLDRKQPGSVVYVNFGSITVMTNDQLMEFAWGLMNSHKDFLWVIRPDLVRGDSAVLPPEFEEVTKERGLLASWCMQEEVLSHPSVGGFLTHSGWNSTVESVCGGVPMVCWPFFAEQPTNCRYVCTEWGMGMEIGSDVRREEVEGMIRELMGGGEKGKEMRRRALEWKESAVEAAKKGGSSSVSMERLVNEVLKSKKTTFVEQSQ